MEWEEKRLQHFPSTRRQGKKVLLIVFIVNVVLWSIYHYHCYVSFLHRKTTFVPVKPFVPIYNVPLFHIPSFNVEDMTAFYIEIKKEHFCLRHGTNIKKTEIQKRCVCFKNWFGPDCGIPAAIWKSNLLQQSEIRKREKPRRLIVSYVIDDFIELLDINIHNLYTVVDLFLTIEDKNHNISILSRLEKGYLFDYQDKIMPIQSNKTLQDTKLEDRTAVMLSELLTGGWSRLADFCSDDIFLFLHVSSIISRDVLLFFKLYDNFPEPFHFELKPMVFEFLKQIKMNGTSPNLVPFKPLGCTFQFLTSMCDFQVSRLFSNICHSDSSLKLSFEKNFWSIKNWSVGILNSYSGWQCNFYCKRECILNSYNMYLEKEKLPLLRFGNSSVDENFVKNLVYSSMENNKLE